MFGVCIIDFDFRYGFGLVYDNSVLVLGLELIFGLEWFLFGLGVWVWFVFLFGIWVWGLCLG